MTFSSPARPSEDEQQRPRTSTPRTVVRVGLGLFLAGFGVSHLTTARKPFRAQVPEAVDGAVPFSTDDIVLMSGIAEIGLGVAFLALPKERLRVGSALAAFFVAIFPGNLSQTLKHADSLGLDSDRKRFVRLFLQPVLVAAALFGGGAV